MAMSADHPHREDLRESSRALFVARRTPALRFHLHAAAAVLLIPAAFVAGGALVPPFASDLAYRRAKAAADRADLDDAEIQAARAVAWTPQDAYRHRFLGQIYYREAVFRASRREGYLNAALQQFELAAWLNPYEADTFTHIGWTCLHLGKIPAAEAAFARAKTLDPNNVYVRYSLGTAYLWQMKLGQARAEMEFARRYLPVAAEARMAIQEIDRLEGERRP